MPRSCSGCGRRPICRMSARYVVGRRKPQEFAGQPVRPTAAPPVTILLWISFIASFTGHYFITGWMPTVLSDDGLSMRQANSAMGYFQFGGAIGSFLIAFLLDRIGIRVVALTFLAATPVVAVLGLQMRLLGAAGQHADCGDWRARRADRAERARGHDLSHLYARHRRGLGIGHRPHRLAWRGRSSAAYLLRMGIDAADSAAADRHSAVLLRHCAVRDCNRRNGRRMSAAAWSSPRRISRISCTHSNAARRTPRAACHPLPPPQGKWGLRSN